MLGFQNYNNDNYHIFDSFKYLPNKTSKYAGICIGSAASVEYELGELRNSKRHAKQALQVLEQLSNRDKKMESMIELTLRKVLNDLGEKKDIDIDFGSLGLWKESNESVVKDKK